MGCVIGTQKNPKCFLEVAVDGNSFGQLIIEVRRDVVPLTAENFCSLCSGKQGNSYKGSAVNRIVPGFMAQGGDCGNSIYGKRFDDENFKLLHKGRGILSMANNGPHTNGSQFFISLGDCSQLDGKHVVFGKVVNGKEVLNVIEECGTPEGRTIRKVTIADCGILEDS
ncbi:hypothetical protein KP509_21G028600 [Ceratopteris richardii]|nr:hypothetical protein KP509_21G028600 [Ceratopteris richardii]